MPPVDGLIARVTMGSSVKMAVTDILPVMVMFFGLSLPV